MFKNVLSRNTLVVSEPVLCVCVCVRKQRSGTARSAASGTAVISTAVSPSAATLSPRRDTRETTPSTAWTPSAHVPVKPPRPTACSPAATAMVRLTLTSQMGFDTLNGLKFDNQYTFCLSLTHNLIKLKRFMHKGSDFAGYHDGHYKLDLHAYFWRALKHVKWFCHQPIICCHMAFMVRCSTELSFHEQRWQTSNP